MKASTVQKTLIDNYYCYLQEYGYLAPPATTQVLFATLLLDTFDFFKEYITVEYQLDVCNIMRKLDCCNCVIFVDELDGNDDIYMEGMVDDKWMYLPSFDRINKYGYIPLNINVDTEGYAHFVE